MKKAIKKMGAVMLAVMVFLTAVNWPTVSVKAETSFNTEGWMWPVPSSKTMSGAYTDDHKAVDISPSAEADVKIVAAKAGRIIEVFSGCTCWNGHGINHQNFGCNPIMWKYYSGTIISQSRQFSSFDSGYYCNNGDGNGIVIDHLDGTYTEYAHMNTVLVSCGDMVNQGQIIGYMGSYGNSTRKHLHFATWVNKNGKSFSATNGYWIGDDCVAVNNTPKGEEYFVKGTWNGVDTIWYLEEPIKNPLDNVTKLNKFYMINSDDVPVHATPNSDGTIQNLKLKKGSIVYFSEKGVNSVGNTWYHIADDPSNGACRYQGDAHGYVWEKYISDIPSKGDYVIHEDMTVSISLREKPANSSTKLIKLSAGNKFYVSQVQGGWGYTTFGGKTGWISLGYSRYVGNVVLANNHGKYDTNSHLCLCGCGDWDPDLLENVNYSENKTLEVTEKGYVRTGPYQGCEASKVLVNKPTRLEATGYVKNKVNHIWYKINYNNSTMYIWADHVKEVPTIKEQIRFANTSVSTSVKEGEKISLSGSLVSNVATNVTVSVDSATKGTKAIGAGTQTIQSIVTGMGINLSGFSVGSHTITIKANGKKESAQVSLPFSVQAIVEKPRVDSIQDTDGGKLVTLSCATNGATIYFTTNGDTPTTASNRYSGGIALASSATIRAIAVYNKQKSAEISQTVNVFTAPAPEFSLEYTANGTIVALKADNSSMIYYSTGGEFVKYVAPLKFTSATKVTAYSVKRGCVNSGKVEQEVDVRKPGNPVLTNLTNAAKYAQDDTVLLSWKHISNAATVKVAVVKNDSVVYEKEYENTDSFTYQLNEAGDYHFEVTAKNAIGNSDTVSSAVITSVAPLTVRFLDWDGSELKSQKVKYKQDATIPADPSRKGYTFVGWDKSNRTMTDNTDISANYVIKTYTVTFLNQDGNRIGSKQKVKYLEPAQAPVEELNLVEGYTLVNWAVSADDPESLCDFNSVDSNMTIQAVVAWEKKDLPLILHVNSAERDDARLDSKYSTVISVTNWDQGFTTALLRVSLKTAEGKMVATESRTITLASGQTNREFEFFFDYEDGDYEASQVEAVALGMKSGTTGTAYSKAVSAPVQIISSYVFGPYSEWSQEKPAEQENRQIEAKTVYSVRELETTLKTGSSETAPALDGWTTAKTEKQFSDWTWHDWTRGSFSNSDTINVSNTRTVVDRNAYTQYEYYHYYHKEGNTYWTTYGTGYWGAANLTYETLYTSSPLRAGDKYSGHQAYSQGNGSPTDLWWLSGTTAIPAVTHTETQYYSRSVYYNYYYTKWGEWSDWKDESVAASANREVKTMTLYRYHDLDTPVFSSVTTEDERGEFYTFSNIPGSEGIINLNALPSTDVINMEGRFATVMVYKGKNTDPNESQLQYVGQITIGENNTFSTTFKTKNVPGISSGDYTVCLAVEGSTGLFNIGMIRAPREKYTVTYKDSFGHIISVQEVEEGENAVAPAAPMNEGYSFVGWTDTATFVMSDMDVFAYEVPNTYAVAFVDWENEVIIPLALNYGDKISDYLPENGEKEGKVFVGWKLINENGELIEVGDKVVNRNMVIQAVYESITLSVTFYANTEGDEILEKQFVVYGGSAELPDSPVSATKKFLGWETVNEWWNVTRDMEVRPIMIFKESAADPMANLDEFVVSTSEELILTGEEGSEIYYSVDGFTPIIGLNAILYTEPILLTEDTVVKAFSVKEGKNQSSEIEVDFYYMDGDIVENGTEVEVGTYYPLITPGGEITLNVNIADNPGLLSYLFFIKCDTSVYCMKYDENNDNYICENGEAAPNGMIFASPYEDGFKVLWFDTESADEDGTLFTLNLGVSDDVTVTDSPITITYSIDNTVDGESLYEELDCAGSIGGGSMFGDVNGDGSITTADILRIAKYLVGAATLNDNQLHIADVTADERVTNADAIRLAKYIIGAASLR